MQVERVRSVFAAAPTVMTERLLLRRLAKDDAAALYDFASIPEVSRYLFWEPHPTLHYTRSYLKDLVQLYRRLEYFEWGVVCREDGRLIGTCGFTAFDHGAWRGEIGYSFHPAVWGQGYATEAVRATIAFGFERLGLEAVTARFALVNAASVHVLLKCGMHFVEEEEPCIVQGKLMRIGRAEIARDAYVIRLGSETPAPQTTH